MPKTGQERFYLDAYSLLLLDEHKHVEILHSHWPNSILSRAKVKHSKVIG